MIEKKLFGYDCRTVDREIAALNEVISSLRNQINKLYRENELLKWDKANLAAQNKIQHEIIIAKSKADIHNKNDHIDSCTER